MYFILYLYYLIMRIIANIQCEKNMNNVERDNLFGCFLNRF